VLIVNTVAYPLSRKIKQHSVEVLVHCWSMCMTMLHASACGACYDVETYIQLVSTRLAGQMLS